MVWAMWASPETAITGGAQLSMTFEFDMSATCKKWASTDVGDGGDAKAVNCLYNGTSETEGQYSVIKV